MKLLHVLALLSVLSITSAQAHNDSIAEPFVTWQIRNIHVCWIPPVSEKAAFTAEEKAKVQEIVQKEYTVAKVGITYYGWEECDALTEKNAPHLGIYQDTDATTAKESPLGEAKSHFEGLASLGQGGGADTLIIKKSFLGLFETELKMHGFYHRNTEMPFVYLQSLRKVKGRDHLVQLQMTALHEFGHASGLRHEHARKEAKGDLNCYLQIMGSKEGIKETTDYTTVAYSAYDPNSIMNYCWMDMMEVYGTTWKVDTKKVRKPTLQNKGSVFSPEYLWKLEPLTEDGFFTVLPNVLDNSLYMIKKGAQKGQYTLNFRMGLSRGDINTLRCLYVDPKAASCHAERVFPTN